MLPHDDNSPLSERAQQAIHDGEAAWVQASSGNWDASSWWRMGTALTLLRQQTLRELDIEVPRGGPYNEAFADRISGTKFVTMEPVTRSNLLFLMEPENRIVLDRLLMGWTPDVRARRTHPTTLAQYVRKELRPPPPPKPPKPAPSPQPAAQPAASSSEIERLRKRVTELEAAAKAAPPSPELEATVAFPDLSKLSRERLEREVYKARFQAQLEVDRLNRLLAKARKSEPEQVAALRRTIDAMRQEHARRDSAAKAQQTKAAKITLDPDSEAARQIKVLQRQVHSLREQLKRKDHSDVAALANGAPFTVRTKIAKALYEQSTDAPSRLAALQAWNALGANKSSGRKR